MAKQKNERFIVNKEILPKTKRGNVDWFNTKEIEVYFTDNEKSYVLKVDDIKKENGNTKILLSYDNIKYKKYLQAGQVLNGNLETIFNYYNIRGNKLRSYRLSDDGAYWIGIANTGEEFYFNGKNSEEIMKRNWCICNGYLISQIIIDKVATNTRLNRMVLGVTDPNIVVNHCGRNKMDNRVEMLSISDYKDNAKELSPNKLNNTGITGLILNDNNTYRIQCKVNGFSYTNTYETKDKALIDLLIIQRNYGYRHSENLYYMLNDITDEYINQLINKVEDKIKSYKANPIICKNRFELSEDGSFYYMYDKDENRCKISIEDLDLVKQGNWHHILNNGKDYFSGGIIANGKRKTIFLHRFLMDLTNPKYRHWYVDHLDSDGLNNTRENIVITDAKGNGINRQTENIYFYRGKYRCQVRANKLYYFKTFDSYDEAKIFSDKIFKEFLESRIEFKSREELDDYLKQNIDN